jgi:hypothetical protein
MIKIISSLSINTVLFAFLIAQEFSAGQKSGEYSPEMQANIE